MANDTTFSLPRFEYLVHSREHEKAAAELLRLLSHLNRSGGVIGPVGDSPSTNIFAEQRDAHIAVRIASAVASLFADPGFKLSERGFLKFIELQRLLAVIFGATPLGTADHIIDLMNENGFDRRDKLKIPNADFLKFSLLCSPDSRIHLQPEVFWETNKRLAAGLFVALLSARLVATKAAHDKREQLLEWLPSRLIELSLDDLPLIILHDAWMHCSYAKGRKKHAIKGAINELIRRKLLQAGLHDLEPQPALDRAKPVLLCITEWFTSNHAVYRTLSISLEALKSKYRLVGVSLQAQSDENSRKVFDEVHVIPGGVALLDIVKAVRNIAAAIRPDIVYYLSVGMFPEAIFLANIRLARIQMASLGHSATTYSPCIDYFLVEEDYIGDPECFTEQVVALPKTSNPYRPVTRPKAQPRELASAGPVRIAVAASLMKFNPEFLEALRRIADEASVQVEFHIFAGAAHGMTKIYVQNIIQATLGNLAVIYPHVQYGVYLEKLAECVMFVNPFPFGNMNSIVDAVVMGLPGVCWTGPELHSHIDEGLFKRLGLPAWSIARTVDEYVAASVRLAENTHERDALSKKLRREARTEVLFSGDPRLFVNTVDWLYRTHGTHKGKLLRPPGADSLAAGASDRKR